MLPIGYDHVTGEVFKEVIVVRGFTLVEILVALFIFSLCLLVFCQQQIQTQRNQHLSALSMRALLDVQALFEQNNGEVDEATFKQFREQFQSHMPAGLAWIEEKNACQQIVMVWFAQSSTTPTCDQSALTCLRFTGRCQP